MRAIELRKRLKTLLPIDGRVPQGGLVKAPLDLQLSHLQTQLPESVALLLFRGAHQLLFIEDRQGLLTGLLWTHEEPEWLRIDRPRRYSSKLRESLDWWREQDPKQLNRPVQPPRGRHTWVYYRDRRESFLVGSGSARVVHGAPYESLPYEFFEFSVPATRRHEMERRTARMAEVLGRA